MAKMLDYVISPLPIRIEEAKADPSLLRIKGLTVTHFGYLPGRTVKVLGMNDKHWAFTYIVRGTGYYQAGNGPVQKLEAGSLFWEWPKSTFRYGPEDGGDWDEYYIHFHGSRVQEWIANNILQPNNVYRIGVDNKWIRKIETIGDYLESGVPESADRAALLLESLIYDFNAANEGLRAASRDRKPEFVRRVLHDISENLYKEWNEEQVLMRHHLSRSTLRRIVQQNTGYSLNEYVNRLKIAEAKKLLRLTQLQIKEIAQMLGYEDHTYFSRLFKKYAEMSANGYRNEE
ncbi:AraC family transcriptional regulator [Paenibacillus contaminans]|uniref:AraC family transcriptional regulator n=1 Tax=Paenibacillus contaminans TaxID=450362 RepID=A0A329M274_9BACL|nr:AraC family transcriptional regulator [Paenibacillus contaminans]RAV13336.1 AraC family transcriptional regulator [Paenibacillus contaminans]